jgi:hypothetical protein
MNAKEFYDFSDRLSIKEQTKEIELHTFAHIIDPNSSDLDEEIDLNDRNLWGRHVNLEKSEPTGYVARKRTSYKKYILVVLPNLGEFETLAMISHKIGISKLVEIQQTAKEPTCVLSQFKFLLNGMLHAKERNTKFSLDKAYLNKVLSILHSLKDLFLTQLFIRKIMDFIHFDNCQVLANLIKIFGYGKLKESLKPVLLPINEVRFKDNCKLVQVRNCIHLFYTTLVVLWNIQRWNFLHLFT